MREILFRAWDRVQKKMLPVESIDWRENCISLNEGDNSVSDTFEMFELEQFTGLLDKNGREIYEGDIVEKCIYSLKGNKLTDKRNYAVVFEDGRFGTHSGWHNSLLGLDCHGENVAVEVIGNVHDNPELLGGTE